MVERIGYPSDPLVLDSVVGLFGLAAPAADAATARKSERPAAR